MESPLKINDLLAFSHFQNFSCRCQLELLSCKQTIKTLSATNPHSCHLVATEDPAVSPQLGAPGLRAALPLLVLKVQQPHVAAPAQPQPVQGVSLHQRLSYQRPENLTDLCPPLLAEDPAAGVAVEAGQVELLAIRLYSHQHPRVIHRHYGLLAFPTFRSEELTEILKIGLSTT